MSRFDPKTETWDDEKRAVAPPMLSPADAKIIARGVVLGLAIWSLFCALVGAVIYLWRIA